MSDTTTHLAITPASAGLRRSLRPIEWVVLEDVALDARTDSAGALVAATSARRVAEHLGLTPGAAARALAGLRGAGLITHDRLDGPVGRFGLSTYTLTTVPGLEVIEADEAVEVTGAPRGGPPRPAPPHSDSPRAVDQHMAMAAAPAGASASEAAVAVETASRSGRRRASGVWVDPASESGAGQDASADNRRRTTRSPGSERRRKSEGQVAQLSILDLTDDAESDLRRDATPATTRQHRSARQANAIPLSPTPSA